MTPSHGRSTANVLNVRVDAIDMQRALQGVRQMLDSEQKGYICVAGVHGIMEAQRSKDLASTYGSAEMTIPDGMPLVWVGHAQGHKQMQRVTGPDFMRELFTQPEFATITHYLYGGETGVVELLRAALLRRSPHARIVGMRTPPFRDLTATECTDFIDEIRQLRPDIIWVGISCPKQELFMRNYLPLLDTKIMIGVGAAFDYHTGRIRDSAEWVKRAGLQWLHRLVQDPKRLWRRYLLNNPPFVFCVLRQLLLERLHIAPGQPVSSSTLSEFETPLRTAPDPQKDSVNHTAVA